MRMTIGPLTIRCTSRSNAFGSSICSNVFQMNTASNDASSNAHCSSGAFRVGYPCAAEKHAGALGEQRAILRSFPPERVDVRPQHRLQHIVLIPVAGEGGSVIDADEDSARPARADLAGDAEENVGAVFQLSGIDAAVDALLEEAL